jgi:hypothetical protein
LRPLNRSPFWARCMRPRTSKRRSPTGSAEPVSLKRT